MIDLFMCVILITSIFQSESNYVRHLKEEHNCTPEDLEEAEVRVVLFRLIKPSHYKMLLFIR